MKVDLGSKPYDGPEPQLATDSPKHVPYYPSTELEDENIPTDLLGKDIKVEVTVRLTRAEVVKEEGKDAKTRCRIEFRKIDFGNKLKDQDVQDDIKDAIEGLAEDRMIE